MTDLQCPATAVLLDGSADPPSWLERLRIAGHFEVKSTAERASGVVALVEEMADVFRGETFVVTAGPEAIGQALRSQGVAGTAPIVVEIDSGGWHRVPDL